MCNPHPHASTVEMLPSLLDMLYTAIRGAQAELAECEGDADIPEGLYMAFRCVREAVNGTLSAHDALQSEREALLRALREGNARIEEMGLELAELYSALEHITAPKEGANTAMETEVDNG